MRPATLPLSMTLLLAMWSADTAMAKEAATVQRYHKKVRSFSKLPLDPNHRGHGQRAFTTAKRFAQEQGLPHFEVTLKNGQKRLVVNVHGKDNLTRYNTVFSGQKGFMEHYFSYKAEKQPPWSNLRVSNRSYDEYGRGDSYRTKLSSTKSVRMAFPFSASRKELASRMNALITTPNPPFDQPVPNLGGVLQGKFLRNCTDWLTAVNHALTGIKTNSVRRHAAGLMDGDGTTERMTVQAVITKKPIEGFGPESLARSW